MLNLYRKNYIWIWSVIVITVIMIIFFNGHKSISESSVLSRQMAVAADEIILKVTGHHERGLGEIELIIRKLAHFIEYFIFGTIVFIATGKWFRNQIVRYLVCFMIAMPIPVIEELIQHYSVGRGSDFLDVMIDLTGAIAAVFIGSVYTITGNTVLKRESVEDENRK